MTPARDCILYARFSSDRQNPRSCDDQLRDARKYASTQGWRVVGEYQDAGISGTKSRSGRAGWDRMLAHIEGGGLQAGGIVLTWDIDRWSRDWADGMIEALRLHQLGINLADTKDGVLEQAGLTGKILLTLKVAGADEFIHKLRRNVKRGLDAKREAGYWTSPAPYGYALERTTGGCILRPIAEQAHQVQRVYDLVAGGATPAAAARALNASGSRTARGNHWTPYAVRHLVNSPVYLGKIAVYGGGRHRANPHRAVPVRILEGRHQPLVDQLVWEEARRRLAVVPRGPNGKAVHPLSGLVYCGECGSRAHLSGGDDHYRYYECPCRKLGAGCSSMAIVRVGALENAVRAWVRDQLGNPAVIREAAARAALADLHAHQLASAAAAPVHAEIRELEHRQACLLAALYSGDAPAIVNRALAEVEVLLEAAAARLAGAGGEARMVDPAALAAGIEAGLQAASFDLAGVRGVIDRITMPTARGGIPVLRACGLVWDLHVDGTRKVRSDKGVARQPRP